MHELILWLPDIKFRHQTLFGSKSANLGLIARELKTPPGFCLSSTAYFSSLYRSGVLNQITSSAESVQALDIDSISSTSAQIEEIILNVPIPTEIESALQEAYDKLVAGRPEVKVAVRSSATSEDLPTASFAGQMESYLNIDSFPQMLEAIKKCWASLWSPRAIHYRFQKDIGQVQIGMAVIIQEMVPAEIAGVMFTANPVSSSRKEYYIAAVKGLGESLVRGEKNADRYIVAKEGLYITSKETVESEPYLIDYHIKRLAICGSKLEYYYQDYQDIEWAFAKGELYLLQTRPITTLADEMPEQIPPEKMTPIQRDVWVNVNERFPEPILPIDGVIAKIYYLSLFTAYQELGFTVPYVDWRRVEEGLFPELFMPPAIKSGISRPFKLLKMTGMDIAKEWQINEKILDRYLNLLKYEKLKTFPLEIIMEYIEDALKDFQRALIFRYMLYIQYNSLYNLMSKLFALLFGPEGLQLQADLVAGQPQLTMELNKKLEELALAAKQQEEVSKIILNEEVNLIREQLEGIPSGQEFLQQFDAFLDKYGVRELSQGLGGLATPTWREKPEVVWMILRGILPGENVALAQQDMTHRRMAAEQRLKELTTRGIAKTRISKWLIRKLLNSARNYTAFRENSHFYLTQAMSIFRALFLQMGDRLVKRGLLDEPDDIMYLTYWEIKELLYLLYSYKKVTKLELLEKLRPRKERQKRRLKSWSARLKVEAASDQTLVGVGASSGIVSGTVRIIHDPHEFSRLKPGDILVAQYTNPAWTPVFSFVGGLVVEFGSTVSHAAIIAREYGVPAIMGVKGVTQILQEGETITIDGSRGIVQR